MGVLTAGGVEPEVEPKAENHNHQEADCQHEEEEVTWMSTGNGSI